MSEAKDIKIYIDSVRYEVEASLFSDGDDGEDLLKLIESGGELEPEKMQMNTLGKLCEKDGRTEISYEETELTGMEGSSTVISFDQKNEGVVTMLRTGLVSTALVFEAGKRHHCVYSTPYMPFEVCVHTLSVKNDVTANGYLEIDYIVEIRGARAERTKFSMKLNA